MTRAGSLVLFDIDGTLMRGAGPHHKDSLIEGIRRVTGLVTSLEGVSTQGTLDRDLIGHMLRAGGYSEGRARKVLHEVMTECQSAYVDNCAIDLRANLCAGVVELVTELKERGAVLGLVTGNLSQIGWKKMELAGIGGFFSVGAFAEDGRTRARLARVAAQKSIREGLVRKDARISLIGDHSNDVVAAKANNFQSVAVASGLMPFEELRKSEPDILVRSLGELDAGALMESVPR